MTESKDFARVEEFSDPIKDGEYWIVFVGGFAVYSFLSTTKNALAHAEGLAKSINEAMSAKLKADGWKSPEKSTELEDLYTGQKVLNDTRFWEKQKAEEKLKIALAALNVAEKALSCAKSFFNESGDSAMEVEMEEALAKIREAKGA